jgi:hypothetical protein
MVFIKTLKDTSSPLTLELFDILPLQCLLIFANDTRDDSIGTDWNNCNNTYKLSRKEKTGGNTPKDKPQP